MRQRESLRSGQTGTTCPRCQAQRRHRPGSECSVHVGRTRPGSSECHSGPPFRFFARGAARIGLWGHYAVECLFLGKRPHPQRRFVIPAATTRQRMKQSQEVDGGGAPDKDGGSGRVLVHYNEQQHEGAADEQQEPTPLPSQLATHWHPFTSLVYVLLLPKDFNPDALFHSRLLTIQTTKQETCTTIVSLKAATWSRDGAALSRRSSSSWRSLFPR